MLWNSVRVYGPKLVFFTGPKILPSTFEINGKPIFWITMGNPNWEVMLEGDESVST
jgi:hypothetical protein